jgi:predicted dithiol-disulfide oxidoreductase (DUF899 family)
MCTSLLSAWDGEVPDIQQRVALTVVARSSIERLVAFKRERGLRHLPLYQNVSFEFSRDYHGLTENGGDDAGLNVFTRKGGAIRHFLGGEIIGAFADPGQDPRGVPDLTPLRTIPDVTPQGRETDGYPKLNYARPACALLRKCAGSARAFPSQIGTARQRPALNPHLTKSRLNDALRLCEMHRRNFG